MTVFGMLKIKTISFILASATLALAIAFVAIAAIGPLIAAPTPVTRVSVPLHMPKSEELHDLLASGQFADLDRHFGRIQARYEAGNLTEAHVAKLYSVFERADLALEEPLQRWRTAVPDSFAAHLASGLYHMKLAWVTRGEAPESTPNDKQLDGMRGLLDKARPYLMEAIKRKPKLPSAWAALIADAMVRGERKSVAKIYSMARSEIPGSSMVHRHYHDANSTRWNGSPITQFFLRIQLRLLHSDDPGFRWAYFYADQKKVDALLRDEYTSELRQFIDIVAWAVSAGDLVDWVYSFFPHEDPDAAALRTLDNMILFWDTAWARNRRGDILYRLQRYEGVIAEYGRAVEKSPHWMESRRNLARYLRRSRRFLDAHYHWKKIIKRDPYHPALLVEYAKFLQGIEEKEAAGKHLKQALVFGGSDDRVRHEVGVLYWTLGLPQDAVTELKKAVDLVPDNPRNWYFYAQSLERVKNCKAQRAFEKYVDMCLNLYHCPTNEVSIAQNSIENIKDGCD
jgi:tetratricopeptide (TPR) repeat protein